MGVRNSLTWPLDNSSLAFWVGSLLARQDDEDVVGCVLIERVIVPILVNGCDMHNLILNLFDVMAELFVNYVNNPIVFW